MPSDRHPKGVRCVTGYDPASPIARAQKAAEIANEKGDVVQATRMAKAAENLRRFANTENADDGKKLDIGHKPIIKIGLE